jgi:hypothetical protein
MPAASRTVPGVDVYRGLAVVLMFVVHAARLEQQPCPGLAQRALDLAMWAEPFIAASFLFLVGVGLVLSKTRRTQPGAYRRRLLRRATGLYVLAVLLFVPQYGLGWPDLVVSPGILSAIALSIALVGLGLGWPRSAATLVILALAVLGCTALLDRTGVTVAGLNGGPGGAFPLVAFAAAGALATRLWQRSGLRALGIATAVTALPLVGVLLGHLRFTTEQTSLYADYGGTLALERLLMPPATRHAVTFWNHSAAGALGLLLPLGVCLGTSLGVGPRTAEWPPLRLLGLLGRQALPLYVGHLLVLGLCVLGGLEPRGALGTWALVALLVAASGVAAAARERWRRGRVGAPT